MQRFYSTLYHQRWSFWMNEAHEVYKNAPLAGSAILELHRLPVNISQLQ